MFETHSQIINGHLYSGLSESFTGGKVETENRLTTGLRSPFEWIMKHNLHTIHTFNTITNSAITANAEIPQFWEYTSVGVNYNTTNNENIYKLVRRQK
jgi:hypothetical protein